MEIVYKKVQRRYPNIDFPIFYFLIVVRRYIQKLRHLTLLNTLDDGDLFRHDILNNELTHTQQKEDLEPVLRFTAVHTLLLGMQAGRKLR